MVRIITDNNTCFIYLNTFINMLKVALLELHKFSWSYNLVNNFTARPARVVQFTIFCTLEDNLGTNTRLKHKNFLVR